MSQDNIINIDGSKKKLSVICKSIKHYREKLGIEQKELGRRIGVVGNAVSNWENGRSRPDVDLLPKICKALGITLYELFDIDDPMLRHTKREQILLEDYRGLEDEHKYVVDRTIQSCKHIESLRECPEIKELIHFSRSLAAGIGDPTEFDDDGEPIYLYISPEVEKADCVFSVNGESMEPRYHDGDLLLVKRFPNCPKLKPGDVGAFIIGNETYVKQYQPDGLHSFNEDYPTMTFEEWDNVFYIGKVIGIISDDDIANDADVAKYFSVHERENR